MSTITELEEAIKRGDTALSLNIIKTLLEKNTAPRPVAPALDPAIAARLKLVEDRVSGLAAVMAKNDLRDPLDHDGDGRKGGSVAGRKRSPATAPEAAPEAPETPES